ncbi:WXG100 family type VII secretion target [Nocardioides sp. CPCC 205120]|uniref:WXG100 family type VII secretion target n=1 Tax=Nocardioides sp. CPCC 205120 TaxID=3406462 RepID=UPI003B502061
MTMTPETFLSEIDQGIEDVATAIGQMFEDVATWLTENAEWVGTVIGFAGGGIPGGIAGWLLGRAIQEIYDGACDQISERWDSAVEEIRTAAQKILGDPPRMAGLAADYRTAVIEIGEVSTTVASTNTAVGNYWEGRGFNAYVTIAEQQDQAAKAVGTVLGEAASLLEEGSARLLTEWANQISNLVNLQAGIVNAAGGFASLDKATGAWVAPTINLITEIVTNINTIVTDFVNYFIELNVTYAGSWADITSGLGIEGLPGGAWPPFDPFLVTDANSEGGWNPGNG